MALTPVQSSEISKRLEAMGADVRKQIQQAIPQMADQTFADLAGAVYDAGDESVATQLEELSHAQLQRYARELRLIDAARKRLADGEINECIECGDDIGYKRLHVHPVAVRCIRCQTQHERTFGQHASAHA